jgi:FAD dependent oxidoreductase
MTPAPAGGPDSIIEPSRATPVYGEFEVVVVGGGPAGIMAAAAAARTGRSTILLERYGFLGGAGTAGGLSTFCGLHAKVYGEHQRVIHGLADELLDRLAKLDGLSQPHLTINDGIQAQAFDISSYKIAADELVTGAAGSSDRRRAITVERSPSSDHRRAITVERSPPSTGRGDTGSA